MGPEPGHARANANRSFERLYEGHRDEVYRAALRALGNADDAEDVTQTAFIDAYRAILRGSRPRAPRAWLLAIAENVRHRRFRTALRRPREEPLGAEIASTERVHEQADAVRRALTALPQQQREVFLLREISGLSYVEIAERFDSTVASVQMLLFRARQALRAELDPPSISSRRRALGLQAPAWLAHLVARGDTLALAPRGAGAVSAAVLAVTGVTAGALHVQQLDDPRPGAVAREQTLPPAPAGLARPAADPAADPVAGPVAAAPEQLVTATQPTRSAAAPALPEPGTPQPAAPTPVPPAADAVPLAEAPPKPAPPARVPRRKLVPAALPVEPPSTRVLPPAAVPALPVVPPALPVVPRVLPVVPPVPPDVLPEPPALPELPPVIDLLTPILPRP